MNKNDNETETMFSDTKPTKRAINNSKEKIPVVHIEPKLESMLYEILNHIFSYIDYADLVKLETALGKKFRKVMLNTATDALVQISKSQIHNNQKSYILGHENFHGKFTDIKKLDNIHKLLHATRAAQSQINPNYRPVVKIEGKKSCSCGTCICCVALVLALAIITTIVPLYVKGSSDGEFERASKREEECNAKHPNATDECNIGLTAGHYSSAATITLLVGGAVVILCAVIAFCFGLEEERQKKQGMKLRTFVISKGKEQPVDARDRILIKGILERYIVHYQKANLSVNILKNSTTVDLLTDFKAIIMGLRNANLRVDEFSDLLVRISANFGTIINHLEKLEKTLPINIIPPPEVKTLQKEIVGFKRAHLKSIFNSATNDVKVDIEDENNNVEMSHVGSSTKSKC